GGTTEQLDTLMSQYEKGGKSQKAAIKELNRLGIATTQVQKDKELAGAQRQGTVQRMEGFEDGLRNSTKALSDFHKILNWITGRVPGLNWLTGGYRGLGENVNVAKGLAGGGGAVGSSI